MLSGLLVPLQYKSHYAIQIIAKDLDMLSGMFIFFSQISFYCSNHWNLDTKYLAWAFEFIWTCYLTIW